MKFDLNNPRTLATTAVMTALVLALTRPIVPTPVGYTHLGDVAIYFSLVGKILSAFAKIRRSRGL